MKAARYHGQRDVRVEDVPVPHPGEGQVQIAVEWCGLCGSDLHEYLHGPAFLPTPDRPHPLTGAAIPIVQGHEFAGVVAERGPGVVGLSEGDRVAVEPLIVCGRCVACRQGRYNICAGRGSSGSTAATAGSPNAWWSTSSGCTRSRGSPANRAPSSSRWPSATTRRSSRG